MPAEEYCHRFLFWSVCTDRLVWQFLVTFVAIFYLIVSGVFSAGSNDNRCDLWESGNAGRRSRRHGKAAEPALGCWCLGVLLVSLPTAATRPHPRPVWAFLC